MATDIDAESGTGGAETRRTLLKKLGVAGGALVWATPIVQTVFTAAASATQGNGFGHAGGSKNNTTTTRPTTTTTRPTATTSTTRPTTTTTRRGGGNGGGNGSASGSTTTTTRPTTTTSTTRPTTTTSTTRPTTTTTRRGGGTGGGGGGGDDCHVDENKKSAGPVQYQVQYDKDADAAGDKTGSHNTTTTTRPQTTTTTTRPQTTTTTRRGGDGHGDDDHGTTTTTTRPQTTTTTRRGGDDHGTTTTTTTTRPTTSTTHPTTTTSTTHPTTTTTRTGGGDDCEGSPQPGKDISHMDWILCSGNGCTDRHGVQYEFGGGWGIHPSGPVSSQHCLAGLSWRVPSSISFSGWGNAVSLGGGAYLITLPASVKVWAAFSKCGQVCRPATNLGGNTTTTSRPATTTWRFDPC